MRLSLRTMCYCKISGVLLLLLVNGSSLWATMYPLPPTDVDLVGEERKTQALAEDTLLDIARRYDVGQDEILLANPNVDRWLPGEGAEVVLPGRVILPRAERNGLVLNVPEMRLYYFFNSEPDKRPMVATYPVSIGRMDWNTPLGMAKIVKKDRDPTWYPPESLKLEAIAKGTPLPDVVPPGPANPLGRYAMRLSIPGYLIHSTNKPFGVGMRVTHGCVRMYPENIEELFPLVPVQTKVQIVNQPIKIGWNNNTLFLEVHPELDEDLGKNQDMTCKAYEMIFDAVENKDAILDIKTIKKALQEKNGMPVPITTFVADGFQF
ncbi:L,D-transpeptidase family protein [Desulfopila sp. IMCC35006]|uniref:L,D-transpeptidase family protein n=1 Tax=Desulfopila sp. IMCC35006 TaxID=2569542 RepID=UPI00197ABD31|nr:L,D-transpeptidase family protein [Desulfopila sp. IMCC35006]